MASAAGEERTALETYDSVLRDCLYNIIHDTVLEVHRSEKQARMQSAALIAQQEKGRAKREASPGGEPQEVVTTGATVTGNGRIQLHGNPFTTAPEILCPTCRLPRLQYPPTGKQARPPDPGKAYCAKHPYIQKDGCDIYGKSLTLEKPSKKSKAQRAAEQKGSGNKPDPSPGGDGSGSDEEQAAANGKLDAGKPAATSIPSGKCPNCPRYMAFTRIAQHMDRCLGLSGRASSKNALTKISGSQGTPNSGSRASTPKPGATSGSTPNPPPPPPPAGSGSGISKKRKLEKSASGDDDNEGGPPAGTEKKKKKLLITNKKASNPNLQRVKSADKKPPGMRNASPQMKQEDNSD